MSYYPQPGPAYPPEETPESDYYDEGDYEYYDDPEGEGSASLLQTGLAFLSGGCLVFLCMSFCGLFLAALWVLDPGAGLSSPTPIPGSDIGLLFDEPAFPDEAVVNEQNLQLTILDVNRNAALDTTAPAEGAEIVIVTVELVNLGEETANFNERDFTLLDGFETPFTPLLGAVTGALGRGTLPAGEGLEGRLVFEVRQDEFDLRLNWSPGRDAEPRYVLLQ